MITVIGYLPWFFVLLKSFNRVSEDYWMKDIPKLKYCIAYLFDCSNYCKYIFFVIMFLACLTVMMTETKKSAKNKQVSIKEGMSKLNITATMIWLLSGLLSIGGTMVVGIAVSSLIRPMFITRYLYPVSYVAWFICAFSVSRLKSKNICTLALVVFTLMVSIPEYKMCYLEEKKQNFVLKDTLNKTKEITEESMILTNIVDVKWTVADYYFPNVETIYFESAESLKIISTKKYWLILSEEIEKDAIKEAGELGYEIREIVNEGILGTNVVYIYELNMNIE